MAATTANPTAHTTARRRRGDVATAAEGASDAGERSVTGGASGRAAGARGGANVTSAVDDE